MGWIGTIFSKAINNKVAEYVAGMSTYNQALFQWLGKDAPIFDHARFNYIHDGYFSVGSVYECVDLITKKIAACPRIVYEIVDEVKYKQYKAMKTGNSPQAQLKAEQLKAESLQEVKIPRIEQLLQDPNNLQTGDEFFSLLATMYLLLGNSYVYGNGADNESKLWNEIFALPEMHIMSGGMFEPISAYFLNYQTQQEQRFPASQVAHLKTVNPDYSVTGSQLYGVPPLRAYGESLQRSRMGNREANKQINNGGSYGFISPRNKEDQFGATQKDGVQEMIRKAKEGITSMDRIRISSIPLEWQQIGLNSADLELYKAMQMTDEDVYRCFHVPLTFRSTDAATLNNVSENNRSFIYNAVAPIADKISDTLTRFICRPYAEKKNGGKRLVIQLDYTSLPELAKDMKTLAEWLEVAWWITPNQKLEAMGYGKSTQHGMDDVWIGSGLRPIEDAAISEVDFSNAFNEAAGRE